MRLLALFFGGETVAADGRILIDTKIDTKGMVNGTDEVIQAARRMAKQVDGLSYSVRASFSRQADSIQKAARAYDEQKEKVNDLRKKLVELQNQQIPTEGYKNLESEIKKNEASLDKLIEKQIRFTETGGKTSSRAFDQMEYDIENARQKLQELISEKEEMESKGTAFIVGGDTAAIESTTAKLAHEESVLEEKNKSLNTSYEALKNKVEEYGNKISGAGYKTEKAANSTEKLGNSSKKSGNDFTGFGRMMLKYVIGVESLFTLINKLRSALVEGFKNLAQYSTNTNASISGLISSLAQCKNSLATAFDPILQAIAPALNYMISLVTAAATAIAQLIAILTGKGTFIKATKVQKDYAKSLKGTGGAAKGAGEDAEGALAPFDKLNVMAEEASGGGGGGGGGGGAGIEDMFETVPVDNNLTEAIEAIKARLFELKDLFKDGFLEGIGDLSVLDSIRENVSSIRDSLVDIFSDGAVQAAANNMINTLAYDMGRITGSFASIGLSILDNITGGFALYLGDAKERIKQWIISMFDISSAISTITANFAVAIAEIFTVFRGDTAKQVTADIIAIFTDSFMGITELAGKLFRDILDIILTPFSENSEKIKEALENFLVPISEVLGTLSDSVVKTFEELNTTYDEHLKPLFDSIRDGISEIIEKFLDGYNEHLAPVLEKLAQKFSEVWEGSIQPMIDTAILLIGDVADAVKEFWENIMQPFLAWFADNFFPVISPIIDGLGTLFVDTFGIIGDIINGFLESLRELIQFITSVFQGDWEGAWNAIKGSFENSINRLPEIASGVVERIKSMFSGMVDGILDSLRKLDDAGGFGTGVIGKVIRENKGRTVTPRSSNSIQLPRLASGTVVPPRAGEFAAILGDNKREPEVVSPLSTMKQAVLEAMAQVGNTSGGDINLTVNLDGKTVYQNIIKRNRQEKNRTGLNPLMV